MGFIDEFKKLTHPTDDEDDEDDYMDEAEDLPRSQPVKRRNPFAAFAFGAPAQEDEEEEAEAPPAPAAAVRQSKSKAAPAAGSSGQLVISKPERFESAVEIANNLRSGRPVLMTLETTTKETARRLIDFLSGVAYAQGGKIKKVSANTYIITPNGVALMGDLMDELESTGLYF